MLYNSLLSAGIPVVIVGVLCNWYSKLSLLLDVIMQSGLYTSVLSLVCLGLVLSDIFVE